MSHFCTIVLIPNETRDDAHDEVLVGPRPPWPAVPVKRMPDVQKRRPGISFYGKWGLCEDT